MNSIVSHIRIILVLLVHLIASAVLHADDWPRFRGPDGSGSSDAIGLPLTWSADENIVWKTRLPGYGASSPITYGDRIYVTGYSGYGSGSNDAGKVALRQHLSCLDRSSGKIVWDTPTPGETSERDYAGWIERHGYASASPTTDGEAVYAFFGISGVVAYDLRGNRLWTASVGSSTHEWGSAASPIVYENLLIVNASVESGHLYGLDKKSGKEVWKASGIVESYNTPILVTLKGGQKELVVNSKNDIFAFDPKTGEPLWTYKTAANSYISASLVAHDGIVYGICGGVGKFVAVRAGGRGDVTATHKVWNVKGSSNVPSPVFHDGNLYWVRENGIAHCVKADSGETVYRERLPESDVYASALAVDGKIFVVTRRNGTFVIALKPEFDQLAHNVIEDDDSVFNASPVVSRGQLLLRSDKYLYCIAKNTAGQ